MQWRFAEVAAAGRSHQRAELFARHSQQPSVVAAFEIDRIMAFQLLVYHRIDAPCHANGRHRTAFAGAWQGYGFHEDGLASGLRAAAALGGRWP